MAGLSTPTGSNFKYVSLRQDKETKTFNFCLNEKVDGEWRQTEKYTRFEGKLRDVELKTYQYDGEDIDTMALYFGAGDATYKIEANFNILTRSMLNTIAAMTDNIYHGIPFRIDLYVGKDGYNKVIVRDADNPDKRFPWLLSLEEQPEVKKVTVGKKTLIDDSEVNERFKGILMDVIKPACPGIEASAAKDESTNEKSANPMSASAPYDAPGQKPSVSASAPGVVRTNWPTPQDDPGPKAKSQRDDPNPTAMEEDDLPF